MLRLKLSYDNSVIYSASSDGSMCVFGLADRDPKKKILNLPQITASTEFLTPKMQRDKLQNEIQTLKAAIKQEQQNKAFEAE